MILYENILIAWYFLFIIFWNKKQIFLMTLTTNSYNSENEQKTMSLEEAFDLQRGIRLKTEWSKQEPRRKLAII